MKGILLPTDFSNNSLNAIDGAMQIFAKSKCTFFILNVQKATSFISDDLMTATPSMNLYQSLIQTSKKSIDNLIITLKSKYLNLNHKFISIVDFDNFIDATNQLCMLNKIDLVVLGTKGVSGLNQVIFGSNTIKLIRRGVCPMMVIPNNYHFQEFKKSVYLTDYSTAIIENEFKPLTSILKTHDSSLQLLHISKKDKLSFIQKKNRDSLKGHLTNETSTNFFELQDSRFLESIHEFCTFNKVDFLAITQKKRSFFNRLLLGNVSENLTQQISIPLLILRSK